MGKREDDCRLHDFRGLQAHETKIEPALCTAAECAHDLDPHQQDQGDAVDRVGGEAGQIPRKQGQDAGHNEKNREPDAVRHGIGLQIAARSREEHNSAEARQQEQRNEHPPRLTGDGSGDDGVHCVCDPPEGAGAAGASPSVPGRAPRTSSAMAACWAAAARASASTRAPKSSFRAAMGSTRSPAACA